MLGLIFVAPLSVSFVGLVLLDVNNGIQLLVTSIGCHKVLMITAYGQASLGMANAMTLAPGKIGLGVTAQFTSGLNG
jgi:hypothetical protein